MKLPPGVPPGALATSTAAQPIGVAYGEDEASEREVFSYVLPPPVGMSAAVEGTGNKLQTILSFKSDHVMKQHEGIGIEAAWPSLGHSYWSGERASKG